MVLVFTLRVVRRIVFSFTPIQSNMLEERPVLLQQQSCRRYAIQVGMEHVRYIDKREQKYNTSIYLVPLMGANIRTIYTWIWRLTGSDSYAQMVRRIVFSFSTYTNNTVCCCRTNDIQMKTSLWYEKGDIMYTWYRGVSKLFGRAAASTTKYETPHNNKPAPTSIRSIIVVLKIFLRCTYTPPPYSMSCREQTKACRASMATIQELQPCGTLHGDFGATKTTHRTV